MSDNFIFIKKYNEKLYKAIHNAESLLKIDYVEAGRSLRSDVLEPFVNKLCSTPGLPNEIAEYCMDPNLTIKAAPDTLHGKILFFSDEKAINKLKNKYKGIKPLVCKIQTNNNKFVDYKISKTYQDFSGNLQSRKKVPDEKNINPFYFVRSVCNSCNHDPEEMKKSPFVRNYENVLECFRITYHVFACYFNDPARLKSYNENLIPLKGFEIIKSFVPADYQKTGCTMEYYAKKKNLGGFTDWAIIREYRKENVDQNFASREEETTLYKQYQLVDVSSSIVNMEVITNFEDDKTPFYIIAYIFKRKPSRLEEIVGNLDFSTRYEMCVDIAKYFQKLHNLKFPIYHRMLNHNCIYLQDCSDINLNWVASVVKFCFSKIVAQNNIQTVFVDSVNAFNKTTDEAEKKYLAPEWFANKQIENWDKVDIYSLGILFCDILSGEILPDFKAISKAGTKLKSTGVNNEVYNMIGNMIAPMLSSRPDINSVVSTLENNR